MGKERWETDEDVSDAMGDLIEENRQLRTELSSLKEQMLTPEEAGQVLLELDELPEHLSGLVNPSRLEAFHSAVRKLRCHISSLRTDTPPAPEK